MDLGGRVLQRESGLSCPQIFRTRCGREIAEDSSGAACLTTKGTTMAGCRSDLHNGETPNRTQLPGHARPRGNSIRRYRQDRCRPRDEASGSSKAFLHSPVEFVERHSHFRVPLQLFASSQCLGNTVVIATGKRRQRSKQSGYQLATLFRIET